MVSFEWFIIGVGFIVTNQEITIKSEYLFIYVWYKYLNFCAVSQMERYQYELVRCKFYSRYQQFQINYKYFAQRIRYWGTLLLLNLLDLQHCIARGKLDGGKGFAIFYLFEDTNYTNRKNPWLQYPSI